MEVFWFVLKYLCLLWNCGLLITDLILCLFSAFGCNLIALLA